MKIPIAHLVLLSLSFAPALADIAPDPEFGQSLAPIEKTSVAMTAEEVDITLKADAVAVRAVFHLENTGDATKLDVGFPDVVWPSNYSSNGPPKGVSSRRLREFIARVDGDVVAHSHRYIRSSESPFAKDRRSGDEDAWLLAGWMLWDMSFEPGQKRKVEVTYRVPYQETYAPTLLGARTFTYVLKTGAAWKGPIGKALIAVGFTGGITALHVRVLSPAGVLETEDGLLWEFSDLEPAEDVRIEIRRYVNAAEAVRVYAVRAEELEEKGDGLGAARMLAWAATGAESGGDFEQCLAFSRRIVAHEMERRAAQPDAQWIYSVLRRDKDRYEPWECRIVRCLAKMDRLEEARREAAAAIETLEALLSEALKSLYRDTEGIQECIARLRAFAAGGGFRD